MKKLIASATFALFFCLGTAAQAGILLEPFMAYETGKFKAPGGESDAAGTSFGARVGYSMLGLFGALEYNVGSLTAKGTPDVTFSSNDMGLTVGYKFPILFQAYATYFLTSKASSSVSDVSGGGGTRIGFGYTGLPFVALNVEMVSRKYNKLTPAGAAEVDQDNDLNTTAISLSLPFNL
jgi:hypothetical protein